MSTKAYLYTENIQVFPSTRRSNKQVSARLMSENTISNLIYQLLDTEGFVITDKKDSYMDNEIFEFNIHGYYFRVDSAKYIIEAINNISSTASNIYAHIQIEQTKGSDYKELKGQDVDATSDGSSEQTLYKGIHFTTTETAPGKNSDTINWYSLHLFEKINGIWKVPIESRIKFNQRSLNFDINGGEVV